MAAAWIGDVPRPLTFSGASAIALGVLDGVVVGSLTSVLRPRHD